MGFFKNLFKGDFKKIGRNFANNLSEGRLIKGSGFDGVINGAANAASGGALQKVGDIIPDRIGDAIFKRPDPKTGVVVEHRFPDPANQPNLIQVGNKMGWVENPNKAINASNPIELDPVIVKAKKDLKDKSSFIDVNNDGKDDTSTIVVVAVLAFAGWYFFKKRK